MTLVPYSKKSTDLFDLLESDFERAVAPLRTNWFGSLTKDVYVPTLDISEDANNLYVEVDMPGMEKKDVKVVIEGGLLKISAKKETNKEEKKKGYHLSERYRGNLYREIALSTSVDDKKIDATLKNGILAVTLPKKEEMKGKEVQVNVQ